MSIECDEPKKGICISYPDWVFEDGFEEFEKRINSAKEMMDPKYVWDSYHKFKKEEDVVHT